MVAANQILNNHHLLHFKALIVKSFLKTSFVGLLTFVSTIINSLIVVDSSSTTTTTTSSSSSWSLSSSNFAVAWIVGNITGSTATSSWNSMMTLPIMTTTMLGNYVFSNKTRASHNQHHGHHHRHYRDRCHHPFLCYYNLILIVVWLFILIGAVMANDFNDLLDDNLLNKVNQSDNNQSSKQLSTFSSINPTNIINKNNHKRFSNVTNPHVFPEQVCGSIDIRNSVAQFKRLQDCTIVEGYLKIVLIDNGTPKDFENITFPKLREITDYFLLFRVMGLRSLAKMFPNLSVIRGRALFHNYAFVIYEMINIQEIGLKSLTNIVRGDVRIQKNPNLCFVDTVDWSRIARNFLISDNKDQNSCDVCAENCPIESARRNDGKNIGDSYGRICWTRDICQKTACPSECESMNRTCSQTNECCPEQCLGGCAPDPSLSSSQICFLCKNYVYANRCFETCPKNSYAYYNRRCLTKEQCRQMSRFGPMGQKLKFKAFNKECDFKCPVGYMEDSDDPHNCIRCGDDCPKICETTHITNIAQAQSLKGCTIINGSLEIFISNQGMVKELEENLKDLVEIIDYLKIARSFPLISLNFLKNLRIIRGLTVERGNYSLLIIDNPNLQDLWTFSEDEYMVDGKKRIQIMNGQIFVHINPKLCYSKILKLLDYADIPNHQLPWNEHDVSPHSNGDRVLCDNVSKLDIKLTVMDEVLLISFENFQRKMHDHRSLLGYLIYYREAEHQNLTIFDGRDACSNNEWTVIEFDIMSENKNVDDEVAYHQHIIPNLKPYTQYALYIKTYTIDTATKGAQSDIIYFKTKPSIPSQPLNLFAKAKKHDEIYAKWDPPSRPNGEITHYIVRATKDELRIIRRDFCSESITKDQVNPTLVTLKEQDEPLTNHWFKMSNSSESSNNSSDQVKLDPMKQQQQCCSCPNENVKIRPNDVEQSINFEDYLLNTIYVKRINHSEIDDDSRQKRHIHFDNSTTATTTVLYPNETYLSTNIPEFDSAANSKWEFLKSVVNRLDILINDLEHFTEYLIEVKACQNETNFCSVTALTSVKTLPLVHADDIDEQSIAYFLDNTTNKILHIKWSEPPHPNGMILSYQIEYRKVSSKTVIPPICITREHYVKNNYGYMLPELTYGNYSIRLRARSLNNYGKWTDAFHVLIEDPENSNVRIWIIVLVIMTLLSIITYLFYKIRQNQNKLDYISVNPDYINARLYQSDPKWEIPRDKITQIRELGEGSFGKVFEGQFIKDKNLIKCAVKTLNSNALARDKINFLKEADVMKSFTDCHHVVKLLGICSKNEPFFVLMEIMPRGDLRNYLRNNRPDNLDNPDPHPPTLNQIYKMAIEIADGMAYLASKKFVHRDLAARNCMLAEDLTVKIGDFGMTRDICESDYYRKGDKGFLPVRWMSPESLQDGLFTTYSDVWAYGVVLWEMVTFASQPYQGLSNEEVLKFVLEGNHMPEPVNCPDLLWKLMLLCWSKKPKARPSFLKMIEMLLEHVGHQAFLEVSFYNKAVCDSENDSNPDNPINKDESLMPLNKDTPLNDDDDDDDDISDSESDCSDDDHLAREDVEVQFFPLGGRQLFNEEIEDSEMQNNNDKNCESNIVLDVGDNNDETNQDVKHSSSYPMEPLVRKTNVAQNPIDKTNGNFRDISQKKVNDLNVQPKSIINNNTKNIKKKGDHAIMNNVAKNPNNQPINGRLVDTSMV